jgi:hypothetical protein
MVRQQQAWRTLDAIGLVVRRDLCVRCLKGEPCSSSVFQRVGRGGGRTK